MQYPIKEKGIISMKKSDHLTLVIQLKNLSTKECPKKKNSKESQWNFNRKGGWETYKVLTENESNALTIDTHSDVNEISSKFDKKLTKLKFQAFGKCSKKREELNPKVANLMKEMSEATSATEKEKLNQEIGEILHNRKGNKKNKK